MSELSQAIVIVALAVTNIVTVVLVKNHLKTRLLLWLAKRQNKPIKLVTLFGLDNTIHFSTAIPDKEAKTITVQGEGYQYDPRSMLYSPEYQVQAVVIREGTQAIIDTTKWQPGDVDPKLFATALKIAKERGREEARKDFGNFQKLLYVCIAAAVIAAAIGILNYQKTGDIMNVISTLIAMIPKPVVLG